MTRVGQNSVSAVSQSLESNSLSRQPPLSREQFASTLSSSQEGAAKNLLNKTWQCIKFPFTYAYGCLKSAYNFVKWLVCCCPKETAKPNLTGNTKRSNASSATAAPTPRASNSQVAIDILEVLGSPNAAERIAENPEGHVLALMKAILADPETMKRELMEEPREGELRGTLKKPYADAICAAADRLGKENRLLQFPTSTLFELIQTDEAYVDLLANNQRAAARALYFTAYDLAAALDLNNPENVDLHEFLITFIPATMKQEGAVCDLFADPLKAGFAANLSALIQSVGSSTPGIAAAELLSRNPTRLEELSDDLQFGNAVIQHPSLQTQFEGYDLKEIFLGYFIQEYFQRTTRQLTEETHPTLQLLGQAIQAFETTVELKDGISLLSDLMGQVASYQAAE